MLRNMKVGTKILTVLVAPLLVLGVLAGLGVKERLADADAASDVEQFAEVASANSALVHELQLERTLTAEYLASGGQLGGEDLNRQRAATDQAVERLTPLLAGVDLANSARGMENGISAARSRLEGVAAMRQSVDGGDVDTAAALDAYGQTVDALLAVNSDVAASTAVPELASAFNDYVALARAKESSGELAAGITAVLASGGYAPGQYEEFLGMVSDQQQHLDRFFESQTPSYKAQLRNALAESEVREGDGLQEGIIEDGGPGGNGVSAVLVEDWIAASTIKLDAYRGVEENILTDVVKKASKLSFDAEKAVRLYLAGAAAATLLALLLASIVARATTRPLRKLTKAANVLSSERIPRLVEELRSPETMEAEGTTTLEPIEVKSRDEIGQLAEAFNAIQNVTVEVAEEQAALLRKGIGDIFVNLARRNQSLLDRQIEFIDELEAHEEDPDQLEHLFKLDHLATRMRRNAESLLVLAGAEPPRRRARPVSLADVVRVAIGEVEDFTRINLLALDEVTVGGNVAVDLAHLLSELMENATHFSPPETHVEVVGQSGRDGSYLISVSDQGIGMSAEQLAEANRQLAHPPLVGLALSRSLGFIVIGRLAARFDISVRLMASPAGGVTAVVTLPPGLVSDGSGAPPSDEPVAAVAPPADVPPAFDAEAAPAPMMEAVPPPPPVVEASPATNGGALFADAPLPAPAPEGDPLTAMPPPLPVAEAPGPLFAEPTEAPGPLFAEPVEPRPLFGEPAALDAHAPAPAPDDTGPIFGELPPVPPAPPEAPPAFDSGPLFQADLPSPAAAEPVPDPDFWGSDAGRDDGFPTFPAADADDGFPTFDDPFPTPSAAPGMPGPADVPAPPSSLHEALPEGDAFEEGLAGLMGPPAADPAPPAPVDEWAPPAPAVDEAVPPPPPPPLPEPRPEPSASDPADLWEQMAAEPSILPPLAEPETNEVGPEPSPLDELGAAAGWDAPAVGAPPADPFEGELFNGAVEAPSVAVPPPPPPPPPPLPALEPQAEAAPAAPAPPAIPTREPGQRLTSAGLVQRTPKEAAPTNPSRTASGNGRRPAMSASQRSPEEVRAMLSRYRSGLKQGRQPTDANDGGGES